MLENGYVKDHRSLLSWGWFRDPFTAHLWEYLRLAANWDDRTFRERTVTRGQLVTSYPSMAEATGMSIQNVRTAIKHLKQTGEIEMKSYKDYSIITVKNYEKYQSDLAPEQQANQQSPNSLLTGCQQPSNSQLTTNEESKKARRQKGKKSKGASAPALDGRFSGELLSAVQDWLRYKAERKEGYTETGCKAMLTEIENNAKRYGDAAVADLIRFCMARQWRGIIWDRIKAAPQDAGGGLNTWEQEWLDEIRNRTNGAPGEES